MPPFPAWYHGPEYIGRHLQIRCGGGLQLVPAAANGQPAFAAYQRGGDGRYRIVNIQVLDVTATGISHVVNFLDPRLFATFGLPGTTQRIPLPASTVNSRPVT